MYRRRTIALLVVLLAVLAMLPLLLSMGLNLFGTTPEAWQAERGVEGLWGWSAILQGWGVIWLVIVLALGGLLLYVVRRGRSHV
jgi:hypothetical protein